MLRFANPPLPRRPCFGEISLGSGHQLGGGRARISVSKSGVRTSGVLNFDVRYARALNLDVVCTPDFFWMHAGRAHITNCMK